MAFEDAVPDVLRWTRGRTDLGQYATAAAEFGEPLESGDGRMEYTGPRVDEVREEFDDVGYCVLSGLIPNPPARTDWLTSARSTPPTSWLRRDGGSRSTEAATDRRS